MIHIKILKHCFFSFNLIFTFLDNRTQGALMLLLYCWSLGIIPSPVYHYPKSEIVIEHKNMSGRELEKVYCVASNTQSGPSSPKLRRNSFNSLYSSYTLDNKEEIPELSNHGRVHHTSSLKLSDIIRYRILSGLEMDIDTSRYCS